VYYDKRLKSILAKGHPQSNRTYAKYVSPRSYHTWCTFFVSLLPLV